MTEEKSQVNKSSQSLEDLSDTSKFITQVDFRQVHGVIPPSKKKLHRDRQRQQLSNFLNQLTDS